VTHDDLVRMVLTSLTPEQRIEVLTSSRWDRHDFRNMVINHAIEIVAGEVFAEASKKRDLHA